MGNLVQFPNPGRVRREACEWLARIDAGLSEDDRKALEQWLATSPTHTVMLLEMGQLWDEMGVLSELSALFPLRRPAPRRTVARRRWQYALLATGAAVCLALSGWWAALELNPPVVVTSVEPVQAAVRTYETAIGNQSSVRLSDGSLVMLNTNTRVDVHYSDNERRVVLQRGEANFNVRPDPDRPFNVHAGDRVVQAVGTAFNVQLRGGDNVEVTVTEGRVRVMLAPGVVRTAAMPARLDMAALETPVVAGEIAVIEPSLSSVHKLAPEDVEIELAWQHGMLIFRGEPLETVLREVGRYTTVDFEMADPSLGEMRVGGYFRAGDIDGLLVALRENFGIRASRAADGRIVLAPAL